MWLRTLFGQDTAEEEPLRNAKFDISTGERARILADMIAKQIEVEQGLTSARMTWNLTFQGFTIAGYALVATASGSAPGRVLVQTLIALVSVVVAFATLRGLVASQRQRAYLRRCWRESGLDALLPQPFSSDVSSRLGRAQARDICIILMVMWGILIPAGVLITRDPQEPTRVIVEPLKTR